LVGEGEEGDWEADHGADFDAPEAGAGYDDVCWQCAGLAAVLDFDSCDTTVRLFKANDAC
jgi:hypothetical protein